MTCEVTGINKRKSQEPEDGTLKMMGFLDSIPWRMDPWGIGIFTYRFTIKKIN